MEWKEIYKNRFATVEEAVRAIEDGDHLVFGHAAGCPQVVPAEMIAQKERLHDVGIYHMLTLNDGSYLTPGTEGHFRHITNFVGGNSRQAVADDRADFLPVFFYEITASKVFSKNWKASSKLLSGSISLVLLASSNSSEHILHKGIRNFSSNRVRTPVYLMTSLRKAG